jgi:hypothetical protein
MQWLLALGPGDLQAKKLPKGNRVKVHSATGPSSPGGSRDRRSGCQGGRSREPLTGSTRRRRSSYRPDSPGTSLIQVLQDRLQLRQYTMHTNLAPTPRRCHTCRTVPRDLTPVCLRDVLSLLRFHYTRHTPQVARHRRQSYKRCLSLHARHIPTQLLLANGI